LVVPISFTSDHIETLHEIDIEYKKLALKAGIITFKRVASLNGSTGFQKVLAEIVKENLKSDTIYTPQYYSGKTGQ
jgi:ferrochelatase